MIFDHIGVIAPSVDVGVTQLSGALEIDTWSTVFHDPIQKVFVTFGKDQSGIVYEIVAPASDDSPISKTLKGRKNILNHLAYRVDNLDQEAVRLRAENAIPVSEAQPAVAYKGARIQFFLTRLGLIVELVENHHFKRSFDFTLAELKASLVD